MRLPMPPGTYRREVEIERNRQIELADLENLKANRDVDPGLGRIILTSPNGTRYALTVSDAGVLSAVAI